MLTMIISVTLNPSIDKTLRVDDFSANAVFRAQIVGQNPGGKGINVSRAVHRLCGTTKALILIGGSEGHAIKQSLKSENIDFLALEVSGQSRTCYGIIDLLRNTETVINEPGPLVSNHDISSLITLYEETIKSGDFVTLSGSAPAGTREDIYYELITIAHKKKARVVLDTSGVYLRKAVDGLPSILKINKNEIENLFNCSITHDDDIVNKARLLIDKGVEMVIVTQGNDNVIACTQDKIFTIAPPSVDAINSWGCGDSFIAGLCFSLDRGDDLMKALAYAVATATENTLSYGAGFINRDRVEHLLDKVHIQTQRITHLK
jgi:tagatose 6-phosphate kinase